MLITKDENNNIIYHFKPLAEHLTNNSRANFAAGGGTSGGGKIGGGNVLFLAPNAKLSKTTINFSGADACVFVGNSLVSSASFNVNSCTAAYIGNRNYFNPYGSHSFLIAERKNLIIGDACLISHGTWAVNCDAHLLYDCATGKRINEPRSVIVGDHCWLGNGVSLLKGAFVASGAVVGARSVVATRCYSNSAYAGNPVRRVREGVFWKGQCTYAYTSAQSAQVAACASDEFKFAFDEREFLSPAWLDEQLAMCADGRKRCEILHDFVFNNARKNRFALFEGADLRSGGSGDGWLDGGKKRFCELV